MDPNIMKYGLPQPYDNPNQFEMGPHQGFTKVYAGNLPVEITEQDIKEQFNKFAQIIDVKGNANGQFSRYVFAFLEVKGDEEFANDAIRKVTLNNPGWKINIRSDYQKAQGKFDNNFKPQRGNIYQRPQFRPRDNQYRPPTEQTTSNIPYVPPNFSNRLINYNEGERGIKRHKILVRQIWVGGIPERISEMQMRQIMSHFGTVEATQIFPKFAFIKFKLVSDATTAFEKAHIIYDRFNKNQGFRIFFSDPEKRIQIVSNHYEFDRQSEYLPILFLGFPPVTSSFVDDMYMKTICQQYGPIVETYMRKSNNPQTRSYILLTYDNVKNAIRAKQELSRRKDLLGDKRVQIAVLLQQEPIFRGRNLQNTVERFQTPNNYQKRGKGSAPTYNTNSFQSQMPMYNNQYPPSSYQPYPNNYGMTNPPPMMPTHNHMTGMGGYMNPVGNMPNRNGPNVSNPPSYMPPPLPNMGSGINSGIGGMNSGGMMPPPPPYSNIPPMYYNPYQPPMDQPYGNPTDTQKDQVIKFLQSALHKSQPGKSQVFTPLPPPPVEQHQSKNQDWSGYLMRSKVPKVGVDGYAKSPNFNYEQSNFNISYLIKIQDIKFKDKKSILVLEASSEINQKAFEGYIEYLKKKDSAGVCLSYKETILLLPKCPQADEISQITENQLLVIIEDIALYHELKNFLTKAEE